MQSHPNAIIEHSHVGSNIAIVTTKRGEAGKRTLHTQNNLLSITSCLADSHLPQLLEKTILEDVPQNARAGREKKLVVIEVG